MPLPMNYNGDLFVQKAPAATLDVLTEAKQIYSKIDPKYGETEVKVNRYPVTVKKLYETLVTREEMAKSH